MKKKVIKKVVKKTVTPIVSIIRSHRISARVTPKEYAAIKKKAGKISIADFIRKTMLIMSLFAFVACIPVGVKAQDLTKTVKTEIVKKDSAICKDTVKPVTVILGVIEQAYQDSATRAQAIVTFHNMQTSWYSHPVKGSSVWSWFWWIFWFIIIPVGFINGCITRFIPTEYKNKYKWLRWTENILSFLLAIARVVPNKDKLGGTHKD